MFYFIQLQVTSLLSGTSIKAIVSYISDYISKPALKTYQIFSSKYDVFEKPNEETNIKGDNTRRHLLKIVNSLSSKMEIGSPMASMYLLGNPDHYTNHEFVPFWWKNYVNDVQLHSKSVTNKEVEKNDENAMYVDEQENDVADLNNVNEVTLEDKVILRREKESYVGSNNVDDYKYRPQMYANISLFEWVQIAIRRKRTKKEMENLRKIVRTLILSSPSSPPFPDFHVTISFLISQQNIFYKTFYIHRHILPLKN